jgi:hypothetical protein
MTVLEALAILETAVLECKKRDVNTPEIKEALDLLEPYIRPAWLIPQYRHHALSEPTDNLGEREGTQQIASRNFPRHTRRGSRAARSANGHARP